MRLSHVPDVPSTACHANQLDSSSLSINSPQHIDGLPLQTLPLLLLLLSFYLSIIMGSAQSAPAPSEAVVREKLVERLQAMQVKDKLRQQEVEKGYVQVDRDLPPAYQPMSQTVSISTTEQWEKELLEDPKNRLALSALLSNPVQSIVSQQVATLADTQTFNVKIPMEGSPVTNQRSSGRCWLFAATNVFRVAIMKKHNLKKFELSQAYLFFWDKLEKANYFLEQIIDTADEGMDSRVVQELLGAPVNDGGQWDMVANLVGTYLFHTLSCKSWAKNSFWFCRPSILWVTSIAYPVGRLSLCLFTFHLIRGHRPCLKYAQLTILRQQLSMDWCLKSCILTRTTR